jgi:hypothetical protein
MTASAADITAASESASADMAGDAGNVTVVCPAMKLNIGVFFDGTGNNTANVREGGSGGSYANARSNVSLLTQLYKNTDAYNVGNSCGTVSEKFAVLYVEGIGTRAGWSDWWPSNAVGAATGMGLTGVEARVLSACRKLGAMIDTLSDGVEPREIVVDVFGFSRGAAAARYFVNCFRQGFIEYNVGYILPIRASVPEGRNLRFRFIGIFDTVAAIGNGENDDNGDVNIHLSRAQADDIYHLTARHEYRTNFRLNENQPGGGDSREMLGAHSDVGGGYRDRGDRTRVAPSETHVFTDRASAEAAHAAHAAEAARARTSEQQIWVQDGWIRPNEPTGGLDNAPSEIRVVTVQYRLRTFVRYTYTTGAILDRPWVQVGLSRIPLKIMYNRAVAAGVPFLVFPVGENYTPPAALKALAGALCDGGAMPALDKQREILRNYGHVSANLDSIGMAPDVGGGQRRRWHRTRYPNKPGQAK